MYIKQDAVYCICTLAKVGTLETQLHKSILGWVIDKEAIYSQELHEKFCQKKLKSHLFQEAPNW